jgi:hypothetical protein
MHNIESRGEPMEASQEDGVEENYVHGSNCSSDRKEITLQRLFHMHQVYTMLESRPRTAHRISR